MDSWVSHNDTDLLKARATSRKLLDVDGINKHDATRVFRGACWQGARLYTDGRYHEVFECQDGAEELIRHLYITIAQGL